MSATQGEKIIRLLNLFKTYSALAFTNPTDRPVAIDGIQSCLLKAFRTRQRAKKSPLRERAKSNSFARSGGDKCSMLRRGISRHFIFHISNINLVNNSLVVASSSC